MNLKDFIRSIPDYPKKGILFRDITTMIKDDKAFKYTKDKIPLKQNMNIERINNDVLDTFKKNPYTQSLSSF